MAFVLKSVKVKGFLGYLDINVPFRPDVNFIIGRNGTGKTTFVRLLHSAISADESELFRIAFNSIDILFRDDDSNSTPQLKITRLSRRQPLFKFEFRDNGREKFRSFSNVIEAAEAHPSAFAAYRTPDGEYRFRRRGTSMALDLRRSFLSRINLSWLPLLRSRPAPYDPFDEDEDHQENGDPINSKISDIIGSLSRYLSTLESRAARETRSFQKDYFLSLLNFTPEHAQSAKARSSNTNYDSQKKIMRDIFLELGLEIDDFSSALDRHFERVSAAAGRMNNERISIDDYFSVADTLRLQKIVDRFQRYEKSKAEIFGQKTRFEKLMNDFLLRKSFKFSEENVPIVQNESNDENVKMFDLSSGEKQIFVMFSETLLQEQRKQIFIADEPELSLHVEWQENLVKNIRLLNDNCQIVFATHSPDVVSIYQDAVIDFEKI